MHGQLEIMGRITPDLYDTKSYYQLIISITKFKATKSETFFCMIVSGKQKKEQ